MFLLSSSGGLKGEFTNFDNVILKEGRGEGRGEKGRDAKVLQTYIQTDRHTDPPTKRVLEEHSLLKIFLLGEKRGNTLKKGPRRHPMPSGPPFFVPDTRGSILMMFKYFPNVQL